ncbi:MAG: tyrosine phosphatase family protein [Maricaulaceae bacterium]
MIIVSSLARLPDTLAERRPSHLISLLDPGSMIDTPAGFSADNHLRLEMHDVVSPRPGETPPDRRHVARLVAFIDRWDRRDPLVVHCWAGISRSSATAFIAACRRSPETDPFVFAQAIRQAAPFAWPNARLVALADAELRRNGQMSAAVAAIGPGKSWLEVEAEPYEVPLAVIEEPQDRDG